MKILYIFIILLLSINLYADLPNNNNVMVIYNTNSSYGYDITQYYKSVRNIPLQNIFSITCDTNEVIDTAYFRTNILLPLRDSINIRPAVKDNCLYIVLTKGIPLKIVCDINKKCLDGGGDSTFFLINYFKKSKSLDARLCFLFDINFNEFDGPFLGLGRPNPFYHKIEHFKNFYYYSTPIMAPDKDTISYLVCRIDAYTLADCKAMIDRASNTILSDNYNIVLDDDVYITNHFTDVKDSILLLQENYNNLIFENTAAPVNVTTPVICYSSYGRNATAGITRYNTTTNQFLNGYWITMKPNGALISNKESLSSWSSYLDDGINCYGHSNNLDHNLISDFIANGGTCGFGTVYEPFGGGTNDNSVSFKRYISGYNLIESGYMGTRSINWKNIVIGDPLCRINISCDVNNNGTVDTQDLLMVYNDMSLFKTGKYLETDLNGDEIVDLDDITKIYNRIINFINY